MDGTKKPRVDKDAIIAELQAKLRAQAGEIDDLERTIEAVKEDRDRNYENGREWLKHAKEIKEQVEEAKRALFTVSAAKEEVERRLGFAEGYIAALNGEPYPRVDPDFEEVGGWQPKNASSL